MWQITQNKHLRGLQDLQVAAVVKEYLSDSYSEWAESLANHFKILLEEIPKTNNFSATLMYKVVYEFPYDRTAEIWKLTADGELKDKIFTLNYIKHG